MRAPAALQAIVLDFDGVVADSEGLHLRAYNEVLRARGAEISSPDYFTRYLGFDDRGLIHALAEDRRWVLSERDIDDLIELKSVRFAELSRSADLLFEGAAEFIQTAAQHVPLAIASGALTAEIVDILERGAVRECFAVIVGADQTARSKPAPDPYLRAFEQLSATAGRSLETRRTVAIEDTRWGLQSAHDAGLRCVGVTTTCDVSELYTAEAIYASLSAVPLAALDALCAE